MMMWDYANHYSPHLNKAAIPTVSWMRLQVGRGSSPLPYTGVIYKSNCCYLAYWGVGGRQDVASKNKCDSCLWTELSIYKTWIQQHKVNLRSQQESSITASFQSFTCWRFGSKLYKAFPCGSSTVIYNNNSSFHWAKLRECLFQKLIGNNRWKILYC